MKRKLLLLTVGLMVILVLLAGCKEEPRPTLPPAADSSSDAPAADEGGSTYPTSEAEVYLTVDGATKYKLYSTLSKDYTARFQTSFKNKTGVELQLTDSMNGDRLIILGTGDIFTSLEGANLSGTFTSCQVKTVGEKVCISIADKEFQKQLESLFGKAVSLFMTSLTKVDGNWTVPKTLDKVDDYTGVTSPVPVHDKTGSQGNNGTYESKNDGRTTYQVSYKNVFDAATGIDAYEKKLLALGYTLYDDNTLNGSEFATYVNAEGNMTVHLNWFKTKGLFRIVYNTVEYLPAVKPVTGYTASKTPTLTMMQLEAGDTVGLSLVAQLEDGSFIIIDGGRLDDSRNSAVKKEIHEKRLYNFLIENKPASDEKPRITWIFTHLHDDHVGTAKAFLAKYKNHVTLELVIYNLPDFTTVDLTSTDTPTEREKRVTAFKAFEESFTKNYPNAKTYIPHAGEQMFFPGLEIEFYYSYEDMFREGFSDENDTSLVFKLKFASGKSCMVFGDSQATATTFGHEIYGNVFKSDIMQVPHHGAGSATWTVYQAVDPSICLWSVDSNKFATDPRMLGTAKGMDYNQKLRDDAWGVRKHYHQSQLTTINMNILSVSTSIVA